MAWTLGDDMEHGAASQAWSVGKALVEEITHAEGASTVPRRAIAMLSSAAYGQAIAAKHKGYSWVVIH